MMKIAGNRKERDITSHADGALLKEGALFNTEMQKMQSNFRFPRGNDSRPESGHEEVDTLCKENFGLEVVQLYRDYLANFMINKGGTK